MTQLWTTFIRGRAGHGLDYRTALLAALFAAMGPRAERGRA